METIILTVVYVAVVLGLGRVMGILYGFCRDIERVLVKVILYGFAIIVETIILVAGVLGYGLVLGIL